MSEAGKEMMSEIDISVIIPVYNTEKYLKQCLDTVCGQTKQEIEIICVDDGSIDRSPEMLEVYSKQDSRITVIRKKHMDGTGAGAARNLGLEQAKGKYVCCLDADDFFEPEMLETAFRTAEEKNAQVVMWDAYEYDQQSGRDLKKKRVLNGYFCPLQEVFSGRDAASILFQITAGQAWNLLIRHSHIHEKRLRFQETRFTDDVLYSYIALAEAERIAVIRQKLTHYRVNTGENQSAYRYQHIEIMYSAAKAMYHELHERDLYQRYKITFLNRFLYQMTDFLNHQQEYERFIECYELLKTELTERLGLKIYLELPQEKITDFATYDSYRNVMEKTSGEYLFHRAQNRLKLDGYHIPEEIIGKRVIIYGAGKYGRMLYGRIWEMGFCDVVAWVDRDHERIGYPVQSPEVVRDADCDYIMISLTVEDTVSEIKKWLISQGIREEKALTWESREDVCV